MKKSKRITIVIDEDLDKKIRMIQAEEIIKTNTSASYSSVIIDILQRQLKMKNIRHKK